MGPGQKTIKRICGLGVSLLLAGVGAGACARTGLGTAGPGTSAEAEPLEQDSGGSSPDSAARLNDASGPVEEDKPWMRLGLEQLSGAEAEGFVTSILPEAQLFLSLENRTNVTDLDISSVLAKVASWQGVAERVKGMSLRSVHLTDSELEKVGLFPNLEGLDIDGNKDLSAEGLKALVLKLPALRRLDVSNMLTEKSAHAFAEATGKGVLKNLEKLTLNGNIAPSDATLKKLLVALPNLRVLHFEEMTRVPLLVPLKEAEDFANDYLQATGTTLQQEIAKQGLQQGTQEYKDFVFKLAPKSAFYQTKANTYSPDYMYIESRAKMLKEVAIQGVGQNLQTLHVGNLQHVQPAMLGGLLAAFPKLTVLNLDQMAFEDNSLSSLVQATTSGALQELKVLSLQRANNLSPAGLAQFVVALPSLTSLDIRQMRLGPEHIRALVNASKSGELARLKQLILNHNSQISEALADFIPSLSGCEELRLDFIPLRDPAIAEALVKATENGALQNLRKLSLFATAIDSLVAVRWLKALHALNQLDLRGPYLTEATLEAMSKAELPKLEVLALTASKLSAKALAEFLASLVELKQLKLMLHDTHAQALAEVAGKGALAKLETMNLANSTALTAAILGDLVKGLPSLRFLDLSRMALTEAHMAALEQAAKAGALQELKALIVRGNNLPVGSPMKELVKHLPKLQQLELTESTSYEPPVFAP